MSPEQHEVLHRKIKAIIVEELGVDSEDVESDSDLVEDLGADSLDMVEVVMALEEQFDIEVPDEDVEGITTVADIVAYIAARKASASAS